MTPTTTRSSITKRAYLTTYLAKRRILTPIIIRALALGNPSAVIEVLRARLKVGF